ncbi:unnamed protein product [marine sediment metagenome]|uniref:Uncharacterized protein n=1 Tax=marine sediment metagenome TaxID=412755 RepID=X1G745_9ZZZZ
MVKILDRRNRIMLDMLNSMKSENKKMESMNKKSKSVLEMVRDGDG